MNKRIIGVLVVVVSLGVVQLVSLPQRITADAQEAKLTGKQKAHSKLYKEYRGGRKIRDVAATATSDTGIRIGTPLRGGDPHSPPPNRQQLLASLSCDADSVVIGTVKSNSSQLTEDEDFIFTDSELTVSEILKNNPAAPIQPHSDITITRPGGKVHINGRQIEALDVSFMPLKRGERYLLFIKFVPSTGAYKAINSVSSFQLRGDKIEKLTREALPNNIHGSDVKIFVNEVSASVVNPCGERGAK